MENITVTYTDQPEADVPAMTCDIEPCTKQGIFAANVKKLTLKNVSIQGHTGEELILHGIDQFDNSNV